jgi:hypothetical protein
MDVCFTKQSVPAIGIQSQRKENCGVVEDAQGITNLSGLWSKAMCPWSERNGVLELKIIRLRTLMVA